MNPDGRIDLHIHTTASSDGQYGADEIFLMAREIGLKTIAFADHNSVDNIEPGIALSEKHGIEFIPCLEINTMHDKLDLHLLAYFIDFKDPSFLNWLGEMEEAKKEQAHGRLKALQSIGFLINEKDLEKTAAGKIPSGATFLQTLLSNNESSKDPRLQSYIDGERSDSPPLNFYKDYFKAGKPAFVPLSACTTIQAISNIRKYGGIPVQAHPSNTPTNVISELVDAGLMGLEAYSTYHSGADCERFRLLTRQLNILHTAGSDFHGEKIKPNVALACIDGNGYELVERLRQAGTEV